MRLGVQACLVDGRLELGDCAVEDGVVVAVGLEGAGRGVAVPGFVDLQVNGFAGVDFLGADAEGYAEAADVLLETGVTAFVPTFITSSEADLTAALQAVPHRERQRRAADSRRASRGTVPLRRAARNAPGSLSLRPRPRRCSSDFSRRARSR